MLQNGIHNGHVSRCTTGKSLTPSIDSVSFSSRLVGKSLLRSWPEQTQKTAAKHPGAS